MTVRQHFIPRFILKKFSVDGEYVSIFSKTDNKLAYQKINKVCYENNLYELKILDANYIEKHLGNIENLSSKGLEDVNTDNNLKGLSLSTITRIELFAYCQLIRTPIMMSAIKELAINPEVYEYSIKELFLGSSANSNIVNSNRFFKIFYDIFNKSSGIEALFVPDDGKYSFVLGVEYPIVGFNVYDTPLTNDGLMWKNVLYFPISKRCCLKFNDEHIKNSSVKKRIITEKELEDINNLIYGCNNNIIGDNSYLYTFIQ